MSWIPPPLTFHKWVCEAERKTANTNWILPLQMVCEAEELPTPVRALCPFPKWVCEAKRTMLVANTKLEVLLYWHKIPQSD